MSSLQKRRSTAAFKAIETRALRRTTREPLAEIARRCRRDRLWPNYPPADFDPYVERLIDQLAAHNA